MSSRGRGIAQLPQIGPAKIEPQEAPRAGAVEEIAHVESGSKHTLFGGAKDRALPQARSGEGAGVSATRSVSAASVVSAAEQKRRRAMYGRVNDALVSWHAGRYEGAARAFAALAKKQAGAERRTLNALGLLARSMAEHPASSNELRRRALREIASARVETPSCLGFDLVGLERELRASPVTAPSLPAHVGPHSVVILHGFPSGPGSSKNVQLAEALRAKGLHVEVPDLNEDDFRGLTVSRAIDRARRCLRDASVVIGSSFGGYVAALLAERDTRVKRLLLLAPAFDMASGLAREYGPEQMKAWKERGSRDVQHLALGQTLPLDWKFFEDAASLPAFPALGVPSLIVHGERDQVVPPAHSERAAKENGSHVELRFVDDEHPLSGSVPALIAAAFEGAERAGLDKDPDPTKR